MNDYILRIENLCKSYPVEDNKLFGKKKKFLAVNNVSFEVKHGETVGLIGESGCGKTTVGRIITKLMDADKGTILFNNKDITNISAKELAPIRSKIQMIFQDPSTALNPQMKIKRIMREALYSVGVYKKQEQDKIINSYIEKVGLTETYLKRYPHELSGGQKQRICILLALLTKPSFIVADEVVSALDLSVQAQILNLLKQLQQELKLSMLFISHDLSIVYYLSDRILVMYNGEIVESGDCEEIYNNCKHPYTKLLLSSVLDLDYNEDNDNDDTDIDNNIKYNDNVCAFADRCPYIKPICKEQKPKNILINENHLVKCHFREVKI